MKKKILSIALIFSMVLLVAAKFQDYTTKATPVANDIILIADSADGNETKKVTVTSVLAAPVAGLAASKVVFTDGSGKLTTTTSAGEFTSVTTDNLSFAVDIDRYGFSDRTESTLSFDPGTYTLTLTDAGAGWSYYRAGIKYTISGNKTCLLTGTPPATATYYIYIDATDGTLTQGAVWTFSDTKVPVAIILWNDSLDPKYHLLDERHTIAIDRKDHEYLHSTRGTQLKTLGTISGYTVSGTTDATNTFGVAESYIYDEDIQHTLAVLADPDGATDAYDFFYRTAATTWVWDETQVPFLYTASGYIQYDSSGTMTQSSAQKWVNSYLICAPFGFMIIPGRAQFDTLADAQAEDPSQFSFTGFGIAEVVIVKQFTWKTSAALTTKGKCQLAATPKTVSVTVTSAVVPIIAPTDTTDEIERLEKSGINPSLDLNFENQEYRSYQGPDGLTRFDFDDRITITRATAARYFNAMGLLATAASGEHRIDYNPANGECRGLLVEEARENLCLQSEDLATTWVNINSTESTNSAVAPDGATTADTLVEDATGGVEHGIYQDITVTANTVYCASVFLKASTITRAVLRWADASTAADYVQVDVDLATNSTTSAAGGNGVVSDSGIEVINNGWIRVWISGKFNGTDTDGRIIIYLHDGVSITYDGDGTSGLYVWGADVEAGAFPTSYIPTVAASVPRNADIITMTGTDFSDWYRQGAGTALVGFSIEYTIPASGASAFPSLFAISDGTLDNRISTISYFSTYNRLSFAIAESGVASVSISPATQIQSYKKAIIGYETNNVAVSISGSDTTADASAVIPTVNKLNIGSSPVDAFHANGHIKRLTYYPKRLVNTTLKALTR